MFLSRNFILNQTNQLNEQTAMMSDDLNTRLKGYLDNDELLTVLVSEFASLEDGEYELKNLDKTKFGIQSEDTIWVKIDKSDINSPKFFMWIMNEQFLWGDIDMETAANILKAGGEGTSWTEKGMIGAIGSFFSGGGEDSGTDEETIAALAGAFAQIAAEKGADPEMYFNKLSEVFKAKHGQTITDFLETEFSGYAETVALNTFRQKIEPSVWRGLNPWSILGDIALTIVTFGGSAAFRGGLAGVQIANAASKANKVTRAGKALATGSAAIGKGTGTLIRATKGLSNILGLSKVFSKLPLAKRLASFEQAGVSAGKTIDYYRAGNKVKYTAATTGNVSKCKVLEITDANVLMEQADTGLKFAVSHQTFLTQVHPSIAEKILTFAGANKAVGVLAAKKVADTQAAADNVGAEANWAEKGAEAMGWYDTVAADPRQQINNLKQMGASDIASLLLELKNGSGLFGNTTSQEECVIALLATGLTPEMVKAVDVEYSKLDSKMDAYAVLDDELGGDISIFAKVYWTACTGKGDEYKGAIQSIRERIKKK